MSKSREYILSKIRQTLDEKKQHGNLIPEFAPVDDDVFHASQLPLHQQFAEEFNKVSGVFYLNHNETETRANLLNLFQKNNWKTIFCPDKKHRQLLNDCESGFTNKHKDFHNVDVGIIEPEYLIAQTGSIIVSSKQMAGRRLTVFPPTLIVIAEMSHLVKNIDQALSAIKVKYNDLMPSNISIITGPSRTADIEKTLILGAHGSQELIVFLKTYL